MTSPEDRAEESPFVTIWEAPRATIRRVVATDPRRRVNALFFAAGAVGTLSGFAGSSDRIGVVPPFVIALVCLGIGVLNLPMGRMNAWYKRWVGGLLGGNASRDAVVAVGAWATVPVIVGHAGLCLLQIALYGMEPFSAEHPTMDAASPLLQTTITLGRVLFTGWSGLVSVLGFAEVNGFSIARSIATSLLAFTIVTASIVAIGVVIGMAIALMG
jgi:hypothetical protein